MKSTFLVIYRPGSTWLPGRGISEQPVKEHGKYQLSLYAKGAMKFAGPFTDDAGGASVLVAADEAEARALVAADPGVSEGLFTAEIHPWTLVEWESYLKR